MQLALIAALIAAAGCHTGSGTLIIQTIAEARRCLAARHSLLDLDGAAAVFTEEHQTGLGALLGLGLLLILQYCCYRYCSTATAVCCYEDCISIVDCVVQIRSSQCRWPACQPYGVQTLGNR